MDREDVSVFSEKDFTSPAFCTFEDMKKNGELVDCKIAVQKRTISAHRVVLAARIPLFRELITKSSRGVIKLKEEVDPNSLEAVINFAYSGTIKITTENVRALISASACLQVTQVYDACWKFLVERMSENNVWYTRELAAGYRHLTLVGTCDCYIKANFEAFSKLEIFLTVPFACLKGLVNSEDVKITKSEYMFEAIISWVKFSPAERSDLLPELLKTVHMHCFTPEYLVERVSTEELIRISIPCRDLVDEAKHYHLLQEKRLKDSIYTPPHQASEEKSQDVACVSDNADGVYDKRLKDSSYAPPQQDSEKKPHPSDKTDCVNDKRLKDSIYTPPQHACEVKPQHVACASDTADCGVYAVSDSFVKLLDSEKEKWITLSTRNLASVCNVALFDGRIYVFCEKSTNILDLKTLEWRTEDTKHKSLKCSGVVVHNNMIYSFGGKDNLLLLPLVRRFDLLRNIWTTEGNMRRCMMFPGVTSWKDRIYVTGGTFKNDVFKTVEQYVPQTKRWCSLSPMLSSRFRHGCASLEGKIYVCGGRNNSFLYSAEIYDPWINQWNQISPLERLKQKFSLVACNGKLYALGETPGIYIRAVGVDVYDPKHKEWETGVPVSEIDRGNNFLVLTAAPANTT